MKKIVSVLLISTLMMAAAGCGKDAVSEGREGREGSQSSEYGEEIFVCDPYNLLGFEGIYADGETVTVLFDEDAMNDEEGDITIPGVSFVFDRGNLLDDEHVVVFAGSQTCYVAGNDIDVDGDEMTMTFEVSGIDVDDITGITFYRGDSYNIDFEQGLLSCTLYGGECREEITQQYNASRDSWAEAECEIFAEPMETIVPYYPSVEVQGMIIPYMAEYIEDEWMPEENEYLFGMTGLEGNVFFEPMFSSVNYIDSCGAYIVGGDVSGETLYGIMDNQGNNFTGLIYDGAFFDPALNEDEQSHFYMTTYEDGVLHVTTYNESLNVTDDGTDITIDEDALPYAPNNLAVCHMAMNGALIRNCSEFYPHNVLIDVETGAVLHDFYDSFGDECLFGDLIIDADRITDEVQVYGYTGELLFDDDNATGLYLGTYRYALAFDGMLVVIDREGSDVVSIEIDPSAYVDYGCGVIGVTEGNSTTFYDADLNVITRVSGIDLDYGYLSGRFEDGWNGNIVFVSFADDTVNNLMNGAVMDVDDSCFYTLEGDYILATDQGDGNLSTHHWYVYDNEFNLLYSEEGYADVEYDRLTGEMYISAQNDGVTTVYSMDTFEPILEVEGIFVVTAYNGTFMVRNSTEVMIFDGTGAMRFHEDIINN